MSKRSRKRGIALAMLRPGANSLDRAGIAQFHKRPPAARDQLMHVGLCAGLAAVAPDVEVVDEEQVDRVHAKPLEAVLERSHDPVVAVVEGRLEREPAEPLVADRHRLQRPAEHAANLARQDEVLARSSVHGAADAVFREAPPVPGGRVEIAHAAGPGGVENAGSGLVVHPLE